MNTDNLAYLIDTLRRESVAHDSDGMPDFAATLRQAADELERLYAAEKERSERALQTLADQAQELDMGYGDG